MTRSSARQSGNAGSTSPELVSRIDAVAEPESLMPIVFTGSGGHVITGPESGQIYCFSSHDPEQMIDARDAEALLKTALFRPTT